MEAERPNFSVCFNPRTYIRYDYDKDIHHYYIDVCFNPRTYIRYDTFLLSVLLVKCGMFQSTYLYKVRPGGFTDKFCKTVSIHVPI